MRLIKMSLALALLVGFTCTALGVLPEWGLEQNEPNPFCNDPGVTTIYFALDQQSEILLEVFSADSMSVRVLMEGLSQPGYYSVIWDGRDDNDELLPPGQYLYTLTARNPELDGFLYQETRVATIECETTPSDDESWGKIKGRYAK